MTGPRPVPPGEYREQDHRGRATMRQYAAAFGRELLGTLLALAGLGGIGVTLTLLAGLLVMLFVVSVAVFALGLFLLFRPDPYDPRFPPQ